jgi:hypothetical protein
MWTLIIAISFSHGVSVDHIDGFASKQACETASVVFWQHEDSGDHSYTTLVCVPKQ